MKAVQVTGQSFEGFTEKAQVKRRASRTRGTA
jgi:hypothetical protein